MPDPGKPKIELALSALVRKTGEPRVAKALCTVCEWLPVVANERCNTCRIYLYRNKVDRPEALIVQHGQRVLERMGS